MVGMLVGWHACWSASSQAGILNCLVGVLVYWCACLLVCLLGGMLRGQHASCCLWLQFFVSATLCSLVGGLAGRCSCGPWGGCEVTNGRCHQHSGQQMWAGEWTGQVMVGVSHWPLPHARHDSLTLHCIHPTICHLPPPPFPHSHHPHTHIYPSSPACPLMFDPMDS